MALSKEHATLFLRDVLHLPDSLLSEKQPSLSFLNEVIKSYQNAVPWQSVTSWAVPRSQRHLPTWEEIKERQFAKEGGMCYENNLFMKELLSAFDFDVCYISCQFWDPEDHMAVLVCGLTDISSRHFVDVGSTCPLFQAIPFDFKADSFEFDIGSLCHRFVKKSDVIVWQLSRRIPSLEYCSSTKDDQWFTIARIMANTPCDVEAFQFRMTIRYTILEEIEFFHKLRAVVYENNKLIVIKGIELVKESNDMEVERKKMKNNDEVVEVFKTYFPQIPIQIVQKAMKNISTSNFTEIKHSHQQS